MARTKNPSYLQRRGNGWYATLDIPKPLRVHFDGQARFVQSLKTENRSEAERLKLPVIAGWKAELEAAKTGRPDALRDLEKSALDWRKGYLSSDKDQQEIASLEINSMAEDIAWKDEDKADAFYQLATGTSFPIAHKIEEWLSTLSDTKKTIHMKRTDLDRFSERFKYTHNVTKQSVRKWTQDLEQIDNLKTPTIRRIVSPCRGYWDYLQRSGHIPEGPDPFEGAVRPEKRKTKADTEASRVAFTTEEVVHLLREAGRSGDTQLSQLIWLGMWTGCRIEELCSLKCSDVSQRYFTAVDAKTEAGNRAVPIHSRLAPLLSHLIKTSNDGYVMAGLTFNKFDGRSNAIGKRFGRLKKAQGFSKRHTFHSIRRTVATELQNALIPESVAADIVGHDKPSMTYGLYSAGAHLDVKQEAIEKLSYPIQEIPDFLLRDK